MISVQTHKAPLVFVAKMLLPIFTLLKGLPRPHCPGGAVHWCDDGEENGQRHETNDPSVALLFTLTTAEATASVSDTHSQGQM